MPALQVRDFPEELYEELRAYAEMNHRSIAQQTIACVESELRRSRERTAERVRAAEGDWTMQCNRAATDMGEAGGFGIPGGSRDDDIPIPPNVRKAAVRARGVDSSHWMRAFEIESDEARDARRAKWEKLRGRFAEMDGRWKGPKPTCEEIVQIIREERDERADRIIGNVAVHGMVAKKVAGRSESC